MFCTRFWNNIEMWSLFFKCFAIHFILCFSLIFKKYQICLFCTVLLKNTLCSILFTKLDIGCKLIWFPKDSISCNVCSGFFKAFLNWVIGCLVLERKQVPSPLHPPPPHSPQWRWSLKSRRSLWCIATEQHENFNSNQTR